MNSPTETSTTHAESAVKDDKAGGNWRRFLPGVYRGARWVFWTQVLLCGIFLPVVPAPLPWEPRRYGLLVAVSLISLGIAFWVNHVWLVRVAYPSGWRLVFKIVASGLYDFVVLLAAIVPVAFLSLAFLVPSGGTFYAAENVKTALMNEVKPLTVQIEQRALAKSGSFAGTGVGLNIAPGKSVMGGYVTDDGVLIFAAENPPVFIVMTPSLNGEGKIEWACRAEPKRYTPIECVMPGHPVSDK